MFQGPGRTFRVGCTSFVLPAQVLPNVEWLAGKVDDIQLLMLEPEGDLPSADDVTRLARLSALYGHSYTVHLPDVMSVDGPENAQAVADLVRIVRLGAPAQPEGWVVHVRPAPPDDPVELAAWQRRARAALEEVSRQTGVPLSRFQVENQGSGDLRAHRGIVDATGCSMCLDVGHVLRDGGDPLAAFDAHVAVAPHLHLHGVADRDHRSLRHFPQLPALLARLQASAFDGVVTIEVFGQDAFEESLDALARAWPPARPAVARVA